VKLNLGLPQSLYLLVKLGTLIPQGVVLILKLHYFRFKVLKSTLH
jgi:hypothetical protein